MYSLLAYWRRKNPRLMLICMAVAIVFSQQYLFHHQIEHQITAPKTAELCKQCVTAPHFSHLLSYVLPLVIFTLFALLLPVLGLALNKVNTNFLLLPQSRAPPYF